MKKIIKFFAVGICCVLGVAGCVIFNTTDAKTEEKIETVHYATDIKYDNTIREGVSTVQQKGKDGSKKITYLITTRHGKEIKREKQSENVIKPAQNQVVIKGTKKYYTCSNGVEYDNIDDKNECEKKVSWEKQKDASLKECYADPDKFDCWYDEYPGTTLHWSYWVHNTPGGRSGAICRDGWRSTATGKGACSHHGGVSYWLY